MPKSDPLDSLEHMSDVPVQPSKAFERELLDELLQNLEPVPASGAGPLGVVELPDVVELPVVVELMEIKEMNPKNRKLVRPAMAAAAALLLIGAGVVIFGGDDDENRTQAADSTSSTTAPSVDEEPVDGPSKSDEESPSDGPEQPAVEDPFMQLGPRESRSVSTLTLDTANALLESLGGLEGLALAEIPDTLDADTVTFDPLNNNRVLFADTYPWVATSPLLFELIGSAAVESKLPFVEDSKPLASGAFQRDGTILTDSANAFAGREMEIMANSGDHMTTVKVDPVSGYWPASEGDRLGTLRLDIAEREVGCPYQALSIGTPDDWLVLDETVNAFARVMIPQPGVLMGFPYFPEIPKCDKMAATAARAWDIKTGEPLTDYPLDGLEIARAAVSSDLSRAIMLHPDGAVTVISMETGETITSLGNAAAGLVFQPLALNTNGTLATVAEQNGRLTLWHVDSGEKLLEITSDTQDGPKADEQLDPEWKVGASIAYDASRVAILDNSDKTDESEEGELAVPGIWTILSLDPNEWLEAACTKGFTLTDAERTANGFDPTLTCES